MIGTPLAALTALLTLTASDDPTATVTLPASGWQVTGLTSGLRWVASGEVNTTASGDEAIDQLTAWAGDTRQVTLDIRRAPCPPRPPATTSPWPTHGYQSQREALPAQRAVTTCKHPDQTVTLYFPGSTPPTAEALLEAADRWESAVFAIHRALSGGALDLPGALAASEQLTLVGEDASRVGAALTLQLGTRWRPATLTVPGERPWVVRTQGNHQHLVLLAPTAAAITLQAIPFDPKTTCEEALSHALKGQRSAGPVTAPPGWSHALAVGPRAAALCARTAHHGLILYGASLAPRERWLEVATPLLTRLGTALAAL